MNTEKLTAIASKILNISIDTASKNNKHMPEIDALYIWNPIRGGAAIIIGSDETFLYATSSVSPEEHVQVFAAGERTSPDIFK